MIRYKTLRIAILFGLLAPLAAQAMEQNQQARLKIFDIAGASFPSNENKIAVLSEIISIHAGNKPQEIPATHEWFAHNEKQDEQKIGAAIEQALGCCVQENMVNMFFSAGVTITNVGPLMYPFYMRVAGAKISLKNTVERYPQLNSASGIYRLFLTANNYGIKLEDIGDYAYTLQKNIINSNEDPIPKLKQLFYMTDFNPNQCFTTHDALLNTKVRASLFHFALSAYSMRKKALDVAPLIKLYIERGADINQTSIAIDSNKIISTPFTFLAKAIQRSQEPNFQDRCEGYLVTRDTTKLLQYVLRDADVNLNIQNFEGHTPLDIFLLRNAVCINDSETYDLIDILLEYGKNISEQTLTNAFAIIKKNALRPIVDEKSLINYTGYNLDNKGELAEWQIYRYYNNKLAIDHEHLIRFTDRVKKIAPQSPLLEKIYNLHITLQSMLEHKLDKPLAQDEFDNAILLLDKTKLTWLKNSDTKIYLSDTDPHNISLINYVRDKLYHGKSSKQNKEKLATILDKLIDYPANPYIVDNDNKLPFKEPKLDKITFTKLSQAIYPFVYAKHLQTLKPCFKQYYNPLKTALLCLKRKHNAGITNFLRYEIVKKAFPLDTDQNKYEEEKSQLCNALKSLEHGTSNDTQHDVIIQTLKNWNIGIGEKEIASRER